MARPSAASERRLPSAGEPAREKPDRAGSSLNSGFWDCWRVAREGGTRRGGESGVGAGAGRGTKWWWEDQSQGARLWLPRSRPRHPLPIRY